MPATPNTREPADTSQDRVWQQKLVIDRQNASQLTKRKNEERSAMKTSKSSRSFLNSANKTQPLKSVLSEARQQPAAGGAPNARASATKQAISNKFSQLISKNGGGEPAATMRRQYDTQRSQNSTMMNLDAFSSQQSKVRNAMQSSLQQRLGAKLTVASRPAQ